MNVIPVIPSLALQVVEQPVIVNQPITIKAGFFNIDSSLTDVTVDTVFILLYPLDGTVTQLSNNTFITSQLTSFGIQAFYTTTLTDDAAVVLESGVGYVELELSNGRISLEANTIAYYASLSLQTALAQTASTQQDIYNLLKQEEPEGVYTQSTSVDDSYTYLDNWVTAGLVSNAESSIFSSFQNVYPELSTDLLDWYIQLFGNDLITAQYANALIQQKNNLALIPSASLFTVTSNIAAFIYNLIGIAVPVYINDLTINPYDYWILGVVGNSELGKTTYLSPSSSNNIGKIYILNGGIATFTQNQLSAINTFISNLMRPTRRYVVIYDQSLTDVGVNVFIGNTYYGDLRIINTCAIVVNPNAFYGFDAYISSFAPEFLVSIDTIPANGSTISGSLPSNLQIIGTFAGGVTQDITLLSQIDKQDNNVLIAWKTILPLMPMHNTTFIITYGIISETITYTLT